VRSEQEKKALKAMLKAKVLWMTFLVVMVRVRPLGMVVVVRASLVGAIPELVVEEATGVEETALAEKGLVVVLVVVKVAEAMAASVAAKPVAFWVQALQEAATDKVAEEKAAVVRVDSETSARGMEAMMA